MRGTKNNTMQTKEEKGGRGETERRGEVGNKEMVCINFNILYKNAVGAYLNFFNSVEIVAMQESYGGRFQSKMLPKFGLKMKSYQTYVSP